MTPPLRVIHFVRFRFDLARSRILLSRNALTFHTFEQLGQVPYLNIGGNNAISQVLSEVLQVDGASPQVQTASQFSDEGIQAGGSFSRQGSALLETNRAGVFIVDVGPVRSQPLKIRFEGSSFDRFSLFQVNGTPVEIRNTEADILTLFAGGYIVIRHSPGIFTGGFGFASLNADLQWCRCRK